MLSQNIYYEEEKKHASNRLTALFVITFFSFMFFKQANAEIASKIFFMSLALGGMTLLSILHYFFIVRWPGTFVVVRKNFLIFLDLTVLTYLIAIFEKNGLFFLPFYIMIVMRSGLSFGIKYFYTSIILAAVSWALLFLYSEYWKAHYDIIVTFAMTTLLIPLFYLKFITRVHEENDKLSEILTTTKHPQGLKGAPFILENNIDLDSLKEKTLLFEGSADEAARAFPANVNVAASLGLAGLGAEKTRVRIFADPQASRNIHEIMVEGAFGKFTCCIENIPSPSNPKTSFLAALSAVATLRKITEPLQIGT